MRRDCPEHQRLFFAGDGSTASGISAIRLSFLHLVKSILLAPYPRRGWGSQLAVIMEVFPEVGPTLLHAAAHEDVWMVFGLFVANVINVRRVACEFAGLEAALHLPLGQSEHDNNLRRGIAVAAVPEGIHAADGAWQAVFRSVEIHRAGFTVISAQDA